MAKRPRHPDKDIEAAVAFAESRGWTVTISRGHPWGRLFCPRKAWDGHIVIVYSTPRNPTNHARQIRRRVGKCSH